MDIKPFLGGGLVMEPIVNSLMISVSVRSLHPDIDDFWQPVAEDQTVADLKNLIRISLVDREVDIDAHNVDLFWKGRRVLDSTRVGQMFANESEVELRPRKGITNGINSGANTSTAIASTSTNRARSSRRLASPIKLEPMDVITIDDNQDIGVTARYSRKPSASLSTDSTNSSGAGVSTQSSAPAEIASTSAAAPVTPAATDSSDTDMATTSTSSSAAPVATEATTDQIDSEMADSAGSSVAVELYQCTIKGCDYKTTNKGVLTRHRRYGHTTGGQLKCSQFDTCRQVFTTRPKMIAHQKRMHPELFPDLPFMTCSATDCHFKTKSAPQMTEHTKSAHSQ